MNNALKLLLRGVVVLAAGLLLLAAVLGSWWLLRPLGWVYALAGLGAIASLLLGAGYAARGSTFGRWLMED